MNTFHILTSVIITMTAVSAAQAERQFPNREFTRTQVLDGPRGSGTRVIEQRQTDNGISRTIRTELDDGRMAQRDILISRDPDTGVRSASVSGTRLNGETYSGTRETVRTEDGFTRSATRVNAAGETATRNTVAVVDREAGTVTKSITAIGFDGETRSKEVVTEIGERFERGQAALEQE